MIHVPDVNGYLFHSVVRREAPGVDTELKVQALLLRIELPVGGFLQFTASAVCGLGFG